MSRVQIKVGDSLLDTFSDLDDLFYITQGIYDLRNLEQRNSDFMRQVSIPGTNNNLIGLNLLSNERLGNESYDCIIIIDGIYFAFAKLFITTFRNNDEIEIAILYGNFEFIDSLPDIGLRNLDFSAYNFTYSIAGIQAISNNTEGAVCIVTMYNNELLPPDPLNPLTQHDIVNYGFAFYVKTIFKVIAESVGYTLDDTAFDSDLNYQDLVLLNPIFGENLGMVNFSQQSLSVDYTYDDSEVGIPINIPFDTALPNSQAWWSNVNYEFTVPSNDSYSITVSYNISIGKNSGGDAGIDLIVNGSTVDSIVFSTSGDYSGQLLFTGTLQSGQTVFAEVYGGYQNANKYDTIIIFDTSFIDMRQVGSDPSGTLIVSEWIDDINQKEFIRGVLSTFNAVMTSNPFSKQLIIKPFNDIIDDTTVNLTKNIANDERANLISLPYYKRSLMTYAIDSDVVTTSGEYTANFTRDESLPEYGTILSLIFGISDLNNTPDIYTKHFSFSGGSAQGFTVNSGATAFTFSNDTTFDVGDYVYFLDNSSFRRMERISTYNNPKSGAFFNVSAANAAAVDATIIKVSFQSLSPRIVLRDSQEVDRSQALNSNSYFTGATAVTMKSGSLLTMPVIYDTYYKRLFDALQTPKLLIKWLHFTSIELSNLDLSKPVEFDDENGKFYINKIEQWKLNTPCRVELIRINPLI